MFQVESSPLIEVQPSRIVVIHHLNMGKTMVMKAMNPQSSMPSAVNPSVRLITSQNRFKTISGNLHFPALPLRCLSRENFSVHKKSMFTTEKTQTLSRQRPPNYDQNPRGKTFNSLPIYEGILDIYLAPNPFCTSTLWPNQPSGHIWTSWFSKG